jgi:hypothetical protein
MTLQGKGFMIWQIPRCEGGNAEAISSAAQTAGLTNVLIKIADGPYPYNIDKTTGRDLVPEVAQALRNRGIQVWGWHYVYGAKPSSEAEIAIQRVRDLGLEGYIIDAEVEFKQPGMDAAARQFMADLRKGLPSLPVALSSFRFPSYHPQLPWKDFLDKCDYNMPQVYWQSAHNAGVQLRRSVREFQALVPYRPIIPTGPVYKVGDWEPTPADIIEFMDTARSLDLPSANYFEWYYGRTTLKPLWDAITAYSWPAYPSPPDITTRYFSALNSRDATALVQLYSTQAVHVTATQTVQGTEAIKDWYTDLFNKALPDATFTITGLSGIESSRHFTWEARTPAGAVTKGSDTIGMLDGNIVYHYSLFNTN